MPEAKPKGTPMARKHKFTRPDNPFTTEVLDDIEAKVNVAMTKFRVLANEEKRQSRRHEVTSRLKAAVMKAHGKFKPNNRCSFPSYADVFIVRELGHCLRHLAYVVEQENATVSCDRKISGSDEDAPTFVAGLPDPRDHFAEGLLKFDFDIVERMLKEQNPVYARIFSLRREGYKLCEIHPIIGVPQWMLYDILWPATVNAVRRIYDHGR